MATFKACVQKERKDGFYPVYIRVTHHRHMIKNMRFLNQNLSLYAQIAILWFTEEKRQWM